LRLRGYGRLDFDARESVLRLLLEALIAADMAYLRGHPSTPRLHESGVRFFQDEPGAEQWKDIPETLSRGVGDCKDLAAWRIAELRVSGEHGAAARVDFYAVGGGRELQHVTVRRASGQVEDPSRELAGP
jgi:hypothetical protein